MRGLLLGMMLAMLTGCAKPTAVTPVWVSPPPGAFLSADGQAMSDAHVAALASAVDFILLGESHTNPCDHAVKARLIEALMALGSRFVIGLEMLPVTAQPVLDRFNARAVTAHDLGDEVGWDRLWGYPYALYRPVFELAERFNLPVAALNIPRQTLVAFRDNGEEGLDEAQRQTLPRRIIPASPAQREALAEQVGLHQSMREAVRKKDGVTSPPPAGMEEKFFLVQALWDSTMAEQALAWRERTGLPVLVLAGSGHVEHGWGIEYRLRTLDPEVSCLALLPVRDGDGFRRLADTSRRPLPGRQVFFHCAAQHKSRLGMNIVFEDAGMRVEDVEPGSKAAQAGLQAGDMLLGAGGKDVREATDLHFAAMAASRQGQPLELTVLRAGQTLTLAIPLD